MWQLARPDAVHALEDPMVKKILPRYVKVAKNEAIANFQILKTIPINFKNTFTDQELWRLHASGMRKFYKIKNDVDKGKLNIGNLKKTKFTLLNLKIELARDIMKSCELCERKCRVNRWKGEVGVCRVSNICKISSEFIHWGEESHIVPSHTIFFMGCPFKCQYCQNWKISQWYENGMEITSKELAKAIEMRRKEGCRNVNFVGGEPTPSLFWVLESLRFANVNVPVIWNSDMYMSEKTMQILEGAVDMHLSDFKYGNDECALRLSKVSKFFEACSRNHLLGVKHAEMTLRHLILPNHLQCCTFPVLAWIAKNIKEKCIVNLMDQYTPHWQANEYSEINKRITREEFEKTRAYAKELKLNFIS